MPDQNNNRDSRLGKLSAPYRDQNLVRNEYSADSEYGIGNLSAGDNLSEEGLIDFPVTIQSRKSQLARNRYNVNKEYNAYD